MRRPTVVRLAVRAYPDDEPGAVVMPGGWRTIDRGRWAGPWRLTRAAAEADAGDAHLVPRGRAIPLTGR